MVCAPLESPKSTSKVAIFCGSRIWDSVTNKIWLHKPHYTGSGHGPLTVCVGQSVRCCFMYLYTAIPVPLDFVLITGRLQSGEITSPRSTAIVLYDFVDCLASCNNPTCSCNTTCTYHSRQINSYDRADWS